MISTIRKIVLAAVLFAATSAVSHAVNQSAVEQSHILDVYGAQVNFVQPEGLREMTPGDGKAVGLPYDKNKIFYLEDDAKGHHRYVYVSFPGGVEPKFQSMPLNIFHALQQRITSEEDAKSFAAFPAKEGKVEWLGIVAHGSAYTTVGMVKEVDKHREIALVTMIDLNDRFLRLEMHGDADTPDAVFGREKENERWVRRLIEINADGAILPSSKPLSTPPLDREPTHFDYFGASIVSEAPSGYTEVADAAGQKPFRAIVEREGFIFGAIYLVKNSYAMISGQKNLPPDMRVMLPQKFEEGKSEIERILPQKEADSSTSRTVGMTAKTLGVIASGPGYVTVGTIVDTIEPQKEDGKPALKDLRLTTYVVLQKRLVRVDLNRSHYVPSELVEVEKNWDRWINRLITINAEAEAKQ